MGLNEELDKLVGIEATSLEVGGIKVSEVRDKKGHVWAVPADDDNVNLREYANILNIPNPEPGFYYQYCDGGRLNEFLTQGFVLVDRDEVGIPNHPFDASGNPLVNRDAAHHQVGNLHLVKIPEVLEKRMRRRQQAIAAEAVAGIKQPRHLGKEVKQIGDTSVEIHERETVRTTGPPIVMPAAEFKEFKEE